MLQILHVLLWNACLATGLAIAIFLAQRIRYLRCQPNLWHALWLLVLLKLVTPPIFAVPVSVGSIRTEQHQDDHLVSTLSIEGEALSFEGEADKTFLRKTTDAILTPRFAVTMSAIGTIALLLVSLSRVRLIARLVQHAEPGPQWMQEAAAMAARQLALKRAPSIRTVGGIVAPFLWVTPRGPIVVVPCQLVTALDPDSVRLIIKHELSHYARRDHWTNTFAMILGALFWWNLVVWWARRELRVLQESCCDRMVLAADSSQRHRYAEALLKTVDFVASDDAAFPSPAMAFASCSTFKRRLEMIVSETPNRVNSRRLQACLLLCAMVMLPGGVTYGIGPQDYEAVAKRLRAAVEAGELTGEQARAMLGTLRKAGAKKDQEPDRAREYLMKVRKELGALVEADKISREDAAKRYEGAEKAIQERMAAGRSQRSSKRITREDLGRAGVEIRKAVAEGKISAEDARARLNGMRRAMADQGERGSRRITREDYGRVEADLKKAVAAGKISEEDAIARLNGMRKMMAGQSERGERRISREDAGKRDVDWEGIKKRIEGAVESGKMTREEADAQYDEIQKRMAGRGERGSKSISREDFAKAAGEIRKAIAEGKITEEQGRAKLAAMRKMIGEKSEDAARRGAARKTGREDAARKGVDWEGIKKRIEGAVKSGDMTREEADAAYKRIRERMAGRRER